MLKKILLAFVILFSFSYAVDTKELDNQKVEKSFKQMIRAYKNKNLKVFISYISENKFQGDFLDFVDSVENDMRVNRVISMDVWIDKITTDGKKRFLYITWNKTHNSTKTDGEIRTEGKSIFLFENFKKRYKLINFEGDPFFSDR
jgi:hypothetical protein